MQRVKNIFLMWVVVSLLFTSCSKDEPIVPIPEPKPPVTVLKDGLNYSSETPDADKELTITFKAGKSSALYSYTGDVYFYTGVIVDGSWMYVPATW